MRFNKNSNIYIIIYIIVLVVVTGAALAFTSVSLKDRQNENIATDKMRQILASIRISVPDDSVTEVFSKTITSQFIVNATGEQVAGEAFDVDVAAQVNLPADERQLPVYVATLSPGVVKYILPVYGAGLWGPIWGYVSLDADRSTIYGAYFAHQGETPGLGAEITKPQFTDQFESKTLLHNGAFTPIQVLKKGQKPEAGADFVDAVSGGTITSRGVASMLDNSLAPYTYFLTHPEN